MTGQSPGVCSNGCWLYACFTMVRGIPVRAKTCPLKPSDPNDCEFFMYLNLKLQLFKTGMRQNRLAQLLGVDESVLSKTVNGYREPGQEMRKRIATLLDCDEGWLFERVNAAGTHSNNGANGSAAPSSHA